jgi:hypothetical protein
MSWSGNRPTGVPGATGRPRRRYPLAYTGHPQGGVTSKRQPSVGRLRKWGLPSPGYQGAQLGRSKGRQVLCIRSYGYGELRRRYAATRAQSAEPANHANHTNLGTTGDPIEVVGGVGRTVARLASTTLVCFQS